MTDRRPPTVLVSGATGFVGRHVLAPLLERGFDVHAISRAQAGDDARVTWHQADLLGSSDGVKLCAQLRPSHFAHFAWYTAHGSFWNSEANAEWLAASSTLCRAFLESGGRRILGVGSCAEYAASDVPCSEFDTPLAPTTLYGKAKNHLRLELAELAERYGAGYAWVRLFHLFGAREHPDRILPTLIRAALTRGVADCASGEQLRDFLHTSEVGDACAAILTSHVAGPVNVGSGEYLRLHELAEIVEGVTGVTKIARFDARPARSGEPVILVPDITRLREEVGWKPRQSLIERIRETVGWWRANLAGEPVTRERELA